MQQYRKNLGKVSLTTEGAWTRTKDYEILSIVYDEHTNHGFISRRDVPEGVDLYNKEYWMPFNVSGYADNNIIILSQKTSESAIKSYTLEEAIKSIASVGRKPGAILGFYNENTDRLDIGGRWELWQYNGVDVADWENVNSWDSIYYNYNKFVGWYCSEEALKKYIPFPEIGCYAYVGSNLNDAVIYRCDRKYTWTNTTEHVWNYIKVVVGGNVTVGENGNWFNNGVDTNIPASVKGENGKTPIIRNNDNVLEVSYDNVNWEPISDEVAVWARVNNNKLEITKHKVGGWEVVSDYIAAWFRWQSQGGQQANSTGKIQITRDGITWTDLSGKFVNNLRISRYIGADESLPTSGIAEGTIYAKGPYYEDTDTNHDYPAYRIWVYAWKNEALAWVDHGQFTSIAAGIVQETGDSETAVMSQKATTEKLTELGQEVFNYDKVETLSFKKSVVVSSRDSYTILDYLGKTECQILVNGNLTPNHIIISANNIDTGSEIQIFNDVVDSYPIVLNNPRSDLELVNLKIYISSTSAGLKDTFNIEVKKNNELLPNVRNTKELSESNSKAINELGQEVFNYDKVETLSWSSKNYLAPGDTVAYLDYLGKTECQITVDSEVLASAYIEVVAYNKETGNKIILLKEQDEKIPFPITFDNPRPDLELFNLGIFMYSKQDESGDVTIQISKASVLSKISKQVEANYSELSKYNYERERIDFNSDTQKWKVQSEFSIKAGNSYTILDYLGKTECQFIVEGDMPQAFMVRGTNKETGNTVTLVGYSDLTELPITFDNPRPDLELINIRVVAASTATNGGNMKVVISKESPISVINKNLYPFLPNNKRISDMPFGVYNSEDKFTGLGVGFISSEDIYTQYDMLMSQYPEYITKTLLGYEATGIPMYRYDFKPKQEEGGDIVLKNKIMILSGTHCEYMAIRTLIKVMDSICNRWHTNKELEALRWNVEFIVIPVASPWAVNNRLRYNSNRVDMARNFPAGWKQGDISSDTYGGTAPLSELEAQYIYAVFQDNKQDIIIGIDFHNHYSEVSTFWIPARLGIDYNIACAFMKLANRMTRAKFDYIPESHSIGRVSKDLPGGSFGYQVYSEGVRGVTFETCNNNIEGFTEESDIITIGHDAFINYILLNLRNSSPK